MLRTSIDKNTSTKVRICQGRKRPTRTAHAPPELTSLFCRCREYPADIISQGHETKIVYKLDWGRCPRHAAYQLWNTICEYPETIPWFLLWEGKRHQYEGYYNRVLRGIRDWLWLAQPRGRLFVITPMSDVGGKMMNTEELVGLVKASAQCRVKGQRFGRPKDPGGDVLRNIAKGIYNYSLGLVPQHCLSEDDLLLLVRLSEISFSPRDLARIAKYKCYKGITWETAKSELKAALDLDKRLLKLATAASWEPCDGSDDTLAQASKGIWGCQDAAHLNQWELSYYVPTIKVPHSLARWLAGRLPRNPERDESANKIWREVKEATEGYELAARELVRAQRELSNAVLITVQNQQDVIANYLDRKEEVSCEERELKQKLVGVLGGEVQHVIPVEPDSENHIVLAESQL